jgi:hypothetical protein
MWYYYSGSGISTQQIATESKLSIQIRLKERKTEAVEWLLEPSILFLALYNCYLRTSVV